MGIYYRGRLEHNIIAGWKTTDIQAVRRVFGWKKRELRRVDQAKRIRPPREKRTENEDRGNKPASEKIVQILLGYFEK
jgi:hypothetical protein